jgi:hypothetical protein
MILKTLTIRIVQMYKHEADEEWKWFESYLTYGNSILPEALMCAYLVIKNPASETIAMSSFDFLLTKTFKDATIKVISNQGWMHNKSKGIILKNGGEERIDIAYTVMALSKFYDHYKVESYFETLEIAFDWFYAKTTCIKFFIIYVPAVAMMVHKKNTLI